MHKTDKFGGTANITGLRPYSKCHEPMEKEKRGAWQFLKMFLGSGLVMIVAVYVVLEFFWGPLFS